MNRPIQTMEGAEPVAGPTIEGSRASAGSIALDQWRGLALLMVLVSHGFFHTDRVHGIGRVGVNLFFFISGVLVFRSLSRVKSTSGWELTRTFWKRRFWRLYPALIAYVVVMAIGVVFLQHLPDLPPHSDFHSYLKAAPFALFYLANYVNSPLSLGHLWSLACEMQFYFIAPAIYLLGGQGKRRRLFVFGGILILLVGLGGAYPIFNQGDYAGAKYHFEFAVWPMMLGFFCEYGRKWFLLIPRIVVQIIFVTGLILFATGLALMFFGMEMKALVIGTGSLLVGPCFLAYLFGLPIPGLPGRFLAWVGERTYSIYLWQQPLTICGFLPNLLHPIGAVISIAVGAVWFHWFERPFLSPRRPRSTNATAVV